MTELTGGSTTYGIAACFLGMCDTTSVSPLYHKSERPTWALKGFIDAPIQPKMAQQKEYSEGKV